MGNEWLTLDEIIASNVQRLRNTKGWTVTELARELGVSRLVVYDMEGSRDDRQQREFKWSDLVALCGALNTVLFELVLPQEGVFIAGVESFPRMIVDRPSLDRVAKGVVRRFGSGGPEEGATWPRALSEPVVGRDGLSTRLFGTSVAGFSSQAMALIVEKATAAKRKRDSQLEELEAEYLGEITRIHEEAERVRASNEFEEEEHIGPHTTPSE
jgi:transcriptional regulator with XRE-family HTH domain